MRHLRKYDYNRNYFKKDSDDYGNCRYYFRCHGEQIEVSKEVYDVCYRSYCKMKNDYKNNATRLEVYCDVHDYGTSFFVFNNRIISIVDNICINDIVKEIYEAINILPEWDYVIAQGIYIYEFSEREIARYLCLSHSTVHYQKIKIKVYLQKVVIDFIGSKQDLK